MKVYMRVGYHTGAEDTGADSLLPHESRLRFVYSVAAVIFRVRIVLGFTV